MDPVPAQVTQDNKQSWLIAGVIFAFAMLVLLTIANIKNRTRTPTESVTVLNKTDSTVTLVQRHWDVDTITYKRVNR